MNTFVIDEVYQHSPSSEPHRNRIPGIYRQQEAEEKAERLSRDLGPKHRYIAREGTEEECLLEWYAAEQTAKARARRQAR